MSELPPRLEKIRDTLAQKETSWHGEWASKKGFNACYEEMQELVETLEFIPDVIMQLEMSDPSIEDIQQFTNDFYEANEALKRFRGE